MRRTAFLALALAITPSLASAQHKGLFVNGHVVQAMGSEVTIKTYDGQPDGSKIETKSGQGIGLLAGFGVSPAISLYLVVSQANQDIKNSTLDITLRHLGLGGRYVFPGTNPKLRMYVAAEAGQRTGTGEDCSGGTCTDFSILGTYFGGGGGVLYFFRPHLAFDGSLNVSMGGFTEEEAAGQTVKIKTDSPTNIRVLLGLSWFPGAQRTVNAP